MKIVVIGGATPGSSSTAAMSHIVMQRGQTEMARLFHPYRPELHYMRGPGPKRREKHGLSARTLQWRFPSRYTFPSL